MSWGYGMVRMTRGEKLLTEKFDEALEYAAGLHREQTRKGGGGVPYIGHLLSVAGLVIEGYGTETQAIAGLLHDAVEDQGGAPTLAAIRERFGDEVADIVDECTDADVVPKPPWQPRKQAYIDHLSSVSKETLLVSLADKLDNARAILRDHRLVGDELWQRFSVTDPQLHLWYYTSLLEVFQERIPEVWLVDALARVVAELRDRVGAAQKQ
jgi:(p)ppGpp synthase/HD superfamily hydrolase